MHDPYIVGAMLQLSVGVSWLGPCMWQGYCIIYGALLSHVIWTLHQYQEASKWSLRWRLTYDHWQCPVYYVNHFVSLGKRLARIIIYFEEYLPNNGEVNVVHMVFCILPLALCYFPFRIVLLGCDRPPISPSLVFVGP